MNSIIRKYDERYKVCAGKGCNNQGIYLLRILYINREGWFCEKCKLVIEKEGLIASNQPSLTCGLGV